MADCGFVFKFREIWDFNENLHCISKK
jgi:hypothetical protein